MLIDHEGEIYADIKKDDDSNRIAEKQIMNALKRENYQRNYIINGLTDAKDNDWIIISDLDEIPNLEINNLRENNNKIIFFKQFMIYYKLNLYLRNFPWIGSKALKKKI